MTGLALALLLFAAAPPVDHPEAARLVAALGARSSFDRGRAERRLLEIGPDVLPQVRRALGVPDPEVRRRALRIVPLLETARDLAPTRITAEFKDARMKLVVSELAKRLGRRLHLAPSAARFTGVFRDGTFWEAAEQVCRQGGLRVKPEWSDGRIVLGFLPTRKASAYTGTHGAFRYGLRYISQHRAVVLDGEDGEARDAYVTVSMTVQSEPRLRILTRTEPTVLAANDDRGHSMLPPPSESPAQEYKHDLDEPAWETTVSFNLGPPSAGGRRIRRLKGEIPVSILVGYKDTPVLEKLERGRSFRNGTTRFTVTEVEVGGKGWTRLVLDVSAPKPNGRDYRFKEAGLAFLDADGNRCEVRGTHIRDGESLTLAICPSEEGKAPAVQLVHRRPITRATVIPFEFRNVPLP
jgi:hypothetical protein